MFRSKDARLRGILGTLGDQVARMDVPSDALGHHGTLERTMINCPRAECPMLPLVPGAKRELVEIDCQIAVPRMGEARRNIALSIYSSVVARPAQGR